jgi:hypothetical protein
MKRMNKGDRYRSEIPGTIYQVDLDDGYHTFARELQLPFVAFYDVKTKDSLSMEAIVTATVLFVVSVLESAFPAWQKIGFVPLEEDEIIIPEFFMQDIGHTSTIELIDKDGNKRPATLEMIQGIERLAWWPDHSLKIRLEDHFANRQSKVVEVLKPYPIILIPPYFEPLYKQILEPVLLHAGYDSQKDESKSTIQYYRYQFTKQGAKFNEIDIETRVSPDFFWFKVTTNLGLLREVARHPNPNPTNLYDEKDWIYRNQGDLQTVLQEIADVLLKLLGDKTYN